MRSYKAGRKHIIGGLLRPIIMIITLVSLLVSILPLVVYAEGVEDDDTETQISQRSISCSNDKCDRLPLDMTECYNCIYENWDYNLKTYTSELCEEYDIPYNYVLAIIWNESRFQPDVKSKYRKSHNYGLMQINSVTFDYLNEEIGLMKLEDLQDPKTNILAGICLLRYHRDVVDNDKDMVFRYQIGEGDYNNLKQQGIESIPVLRTVLNKAEEFAKILN